MKTICATLCYVEHKEDVLMLHRVKKKNDIHEGKWNGLGGKMEPGETPEMCVVREVQEESGLKIKNPTWHGTILFPKFDGENDWLVFVFKAQKFSGRRIESAEGNLAWIPKKKLLDLPLWEGDAIFLRWLFPKELPTKKPHPRFGQQPQHSFFSARFDYLRGHLKKYHVTFHQLHLG